MDITFNGGTYNIDSCVDGLATESMYAEVKTSNNIKLVQMSLSKEVYKEQIN